MSVRHRSLGARVHPCAALLATVALVIAGCGQKGPLYLPNKKKTPVPATTAPAPQSTAPAESASPAPAQ